MKHYQAPSVSLIALDLEDVLTASNIKEGDLENLVKVSFNDLKF